MTVNYRDVPVAFDWVKARSECSVQKLFDDLIKVVKSDIQIFNEHSESTGSSRTMKFSQVCTKQFDVEASPPRSTPDGTFACVMVSLNGSSIEFFRGGMDNKLFSAKPYLLDTGECLLEVEGKPYRIWQISRKAFEGFFFGGH